jgi:rhamnogalacturonyl hydrolase YesR
MKKLLSFLFIICFFSVSYSQTDKNNKIFSKNYIKQCMKKVTTWQLANPKHELTSWTNGAFYAGVYAAWETTRSKDIYNALMDMGSKNSWKPGKRWYHADDIAICQTYIDLYKKNKNQEMIQPLIDTISKFMNNPYPGNTGIDVIKW